MKKAIMFGAGNIGRGFIGANIAQSGRELVFADVVRELVDEINTQKGYTVHILDKHCEDIPIRNVRAVCSLDTEDLTGELVSCDLVTTAVGPNVLPKIAESIALGIRARREAGNCGYLNVICCENGIRTSSRLKGFVYESLSSDDREFSEMYVGFPDCAVDRISPKSSFENRLDAGVEEYMEWDVEKSSWKGPLADIKGLTYTDELEALLERKLFTLNSGHAILAYLGMLKGYDTVLAAVSDPAISKIVRAAMEESGEALIKRFNFNPAAHHAYVSRIFERFQNPHLADELSRVGREPIRKLGAEDRLLKPLRTAAEYGLPVDNLIFGPAAALRVRIKGDAESEELKKLIESEGPEAALRRYSGLGSLPTYKLPEERQEELISRIMDIYRALSLC